MYDQWREYMDYNLGMSGELFTHRKNFIPRDPTLRTNFIKTIYEVRQPIENLMIENVYYTIHKLLNK
jgi:hypothetical protein